MNYNDHQKYYYHDNGNISSEHYYLNKYLHRTNGPADIWYYQNGKINCEIYYLNGKKHRTDGPAVIRYYKNGNIKSKYYHLNDKFIDIESDEEFKKHLKTLILK